MRFEKTLRKYEFGMKELVSKLEIINEDYQDKNSYKLMEHIQSRLKADDSIKAKLINDGYTYEEKNLDKINDIAGVRVVVAFEEDVYTVRDLILEKLPDVKLIKEKDYIKNPKDSGYVSYHLILSVPVTLVTGVEYVTVELQIRTLIMDAWASIEHKLVYKKKDTFGKIFKNYAAQMILLDNCFTELKEAQKKLK